MSDLARNVLAAVVVLAVATGLGVLATMEDPSTGEQIISVLRDTILGESEVVSGPSPGGDALLQQPAGMPPDVPRRGVPWHPDSVHHHRERVRDRVRARTRAAAAEPPFSW